LQVSEQTSRVNQPIANAHNSAPGKKSVTHFVAWLQELNEVWRGGMMSDEDYAFSKAEHLEHLLEPLKRPWRKWIFGVLPVVLIAGGVVSYASAQCVWWVQSWLTGRRFAGSCQKRTDSR
jgi:hypothetical protein